MSLPVSMGEGDGLANDGGTDSPTFVKDGGTSSLGQRPSWASALFVHMARLWQTCWHTHHPFHLSSITRVQTSLQRMKRQYFLHLRCEIVSAVSGLVYLF